MREMVNNKVDGKKKLVTVIIPVCNDNDYIVECLDSVVAQSMFSDCEVLVIDYSASSNNEQLVGKYMNQYRNINRISCPVENQLVAKNIGLALTTTGTVTFCGANDILPNDSLKSRYSYLVANNLDIVIGQVTSFPEKCEFKTDKYFEQGDFIVNQLENVPEMIVNIKDYDKIFRVETLKQQQFNFSEESNFENNMVLVSLLLSGVQIGLVDSVCYKQRRGLVASKRMSQVSKTPNVYSMLNQIEAFDARVTSESSVDFIKMMNHLSANSYAQCLNVIRLDKNISSLEKEKIFEKVKGRLDAIPGELLAEHRKNYPVQLMFLAIKENDLGLFLEPKIKADSFRVADKKFFLNRKIKETTPFELTMIPMLALLRYIEIKDEFLELTYRFQSSVFIPNGPIKNTIEVHLNAENRKNNRIYISKFAGFEGESMLFKARLPLEDILRCAGRCDFLVKLCDIETNVFAYRRTYNTSSTNSLKGVLYRDDHKLVYFDSIPSKNTGIGRGKYDSKVLVINNTLSSKFDFQRKKVFSNKRAKAGGKLRLLYWLTYPFLHRKRIVLIGERKDTFQDNSSHLFRYIRKEHPSFPAYYLIDETSNRYEEVKKYGNAIKHGSLKHNLYVLHGDIIVNSYDPNSYMAPRNLSKLQNLELYGDLFTYQSVFLQHGVTYNNVSSALGRFNNNYDKIVINSKFEESFFEDLCLYDDNNLIKSGFPRFQRLREENELRKKNQTTQSRTILLMPTWRRDLVIPSYLKSNDSLEARFLESDYFKYYQSLLQNETLLNLLEIHNIQLNFLVHYEIEPYLHNFGINSSQIKIVRQKEHNIQDLLIGADLLITDFSSVFFDFLFMSKPVVFAQFDYEDFYKQHYKQGYLDFTKNELGPQCITLEDVVEAISNSIDNKFKVGEQVETNRLKYLEYALALENPNEAVYQVLNEMLQPTASK